MTSIETQFKKGHPGFKFWLGKTKSEKIRKHISEGLKGRIPWNKGLKCPGVGGRKRREGITALVGSKKYYQQNYQMNKKQLSEKSNLRQLKKKLLRFGLTEEEYYRLLSLGCSVCGCLSKENHRLSLDHDHKTGEFRGILCSKCNLALGLCEDDPKRLILLANYIKKWKKG